MLKAARLVVAGLPQHVIQRGLWSMNLFEDDGDCEAYLGFLAGAAEAYGLHFLAWCLMTHHVHLLVTPADDRALGRAAHGDRAVGPGPGKEVPSQIASRPPGPSAEAGSRCPNTR